MRDQNERLQALRRRRWQFVRNAKTGREHALVSESDLRFLLGLGNAAAKRRLTKGRP